jgi:alkane 1-monooxygenase
MAKLADDRYYRILLYCFLPSQFAATVWGTWLAVQPGTGGWAVAGLVVTVGNINGFGINTAHELGHKPGRLQRWLAKIALAPVAYGHFYVEHNRGHHRKVATPEDPASARMGESFWVFLPRTIIGSLISAWDIEKRRLEKSGKGVWNLDNDNLQAWGLTVLLFGALTVWLGWFALLFLLLQAYYGASLLEVVNYVEHYGLLRSKGADGRPERCTPAHSWNSDHVVNNLILYHLQRHSDHHDNPTRPYQALRHLDESPQLPAGYAALILLSYVPPLFFRVMDPLVVKHYRGDLHKANLQPSRREALLKRWNGR